MPASTKSFNVTALAQGVVQAAMRIIAIDVPVMYQRKCVQSMLGCIIKQTLMCLNLSCEDGRHGRIIE